MDKYMQLSPIIFVFHDLEEVTSIIFLLVSVLMMNLKFVQSLKVGLRGGENHERERQ